MVFGAVSLEELLGHCGEALHVYVRHTDAIESRLASCGYEPPEVEPEVHAEDGGAGDVVDPGNGGFSDSSSVLRSDRWWLNNDDDDALYPSLWFGSDWKTSFFQLLRLSHMVERLN